MHFFFKEFCKMCFFFLDCSQNNPTAFFPCYWLYSFMKRLLILCATQKLVLNWTTELQPLKRWFLYFCDFHQKTNKFFAEHYLLPHYFIHPGKIRKFVGLLYIFIQNVIICLIVATVEIWKLFISSNPSKQKTNNWRLYRDTYQT